MSSKANFGEGSSRYSRSKLQKIGNNNAAISLKQQPIWCLAKPFKCEVQQMTNPTSAAFGTSLLLDVLGKDSEALDLEISV